MTKWSVCKDEQLLSVNFMGGKYFLDTDTMNLESSIYVPEMERGLNSPNSPFIKLPIKVAYSHVILWKL